MNNKSIRICLACCMVFLLATQAMALSISAHRVIIDMRGKKVFIPLHINRVATIDDGFIEGVMTHLGVIDTVEAIGSWSMKRDYVYDFTTVSGETYKHSGLNTMKLLHPWLDDKICVNSPQGDIINFEALAKANPDVVIMRVGDCTVRSANPEAVNKTIDTIESLGIPLVVLYAPSWFKSADLATMKQEADVIGQVFGKQEQAVELAEYLASTETLIRERTAGIPENQKTRVLYLGLRPSVRQNGGAGQVLGIDTPESYIIETVAGARNAFQKTGFGVPVSVEQIYALDPDVIILPTMDGYHPPRELYEAPYFEKLQELRAIKEKRVYAMPWSPMNCARRVEYPLDMLIIAKASYPDLFKDISIYEYALELYKKAYHVDDATARQLRTTQLLDWMQDTQF